MIHAKLKKISPGIFHVDNFVKVCKCKKNKEIAELLPVFDFALILMLC